MIYVFEEPVRMLVTHPAFGWVEVKAYCRFDAKLQAAAIWGVSFDQMQRAQVGVEKGKIEQV